MPFDVENAGLSELEAEFQRLAEGRGAVFAEFTSARNALEAQLAEYQEIYGRIEVINAIATQLLGAEPVTDGSPGDDPFSVDILDRLDEVFVIGGALGGLGSLASLAHKIRNANKLRSAATVANNAAQSAARAAVVTWPKLRFLGGLAGLGVSALGIALMVRDHQERVTFYRTNIPIYEEWAADLRAKAASFDESRIELNEDLDDLQERLGYASRDEMKNELRRSVGDVAEYRSQWIALTKMLCSNKVSLEEATTYTGFPLSLVERRAQEIAADPTICPSVAA